MKDREGRQIIRAEILPPGYTKLDQRRAEIDPRQQQLHQQNRIRVRKRRTLLVRSAKPAVDRKRVAAGSEREHHQEVDRNHLVVIEVPEATQQTLVEQHQQEGSLRSEEH